jgi:hypothetical protein
MCSAKRLTLAALGIALLALVLAAAPAHAQRGVPGLGGTLNPYNYYDPYGFARQAAFNTVLYGRAMSHVPPYALGYNPYAQAVTTPYAASAYGGYSVANPSLYTAGGYGSPGYSPGLSDYGGYNSPYYPYPYSYDPYAGFLQGSAAVINADGRFRVNNQQANLLREQVRSSHIDNNRKAFDEFLYERANTPTWLDDLERQKKLNLRYALTNASGSEILAGTSLNTLLDSLKQMQSKGTTGPDVPLSGETLDKINVTAGGGVNPGLLKSERLTWPLALTGSEYQDDRKNVERNLAAAVREAEVGQVEPKRLKDLLDEVDKMSDDLGRQIGEMTPNQYIEARNYLKQLNEGIRALGRPDGGKYVTGQYAAKGKTVADLVKNMQGLQFAAATPGSEQAYGELYQRLREYYNRAQPSTRGE